MRAFKGQVFSSLRSECLKWLQKWKEETKETTETNETNETKEKKEKKERPLFVDPTFPCDDNGIGKRHLRQLVYKGLNKDKVEWRRPHELSKTPEFIVDNASRADLNQGHLNDGAFVVATTSLTLCPKLLAHVVPNGQSFGDDYVGIFHFRFWVDGEWTDVVIDDQLPSVDGRLIFLQSSDPKEFWVALLEKACAKLRGSYEELMYDLELSGAFKYLSGGKSEFFWGQGSPQGKVLRVVEGFANFLGRKCPKDFPRVPPNFFSVLLKAHERSSSLIGCGFASDQAGLLKGYAYSVTAVAEVANRNGGAKIPLIRLRNPLGQYEWKGRYSDSSLEWSKISEGEREKLGLKVEDDGEFWMHYDDFEKNLYFIDMCHVDPIYHSSPTYYSRPPILKETFAASIIGDCYDDPDYPDGMGPFCFSRPPVLKGVQRGGVTHKYDGSWANHVTAGGSKNYLETFAANPQYRLELEDPDDKDGFCTVIVTMTPKNKKTHKRNLGFDVYDMKCLNCAPRPLPWEFFKNKTPTVRYQSAEHQGSYTARIRLLPGTYCFVPHLQNPNEDGDFLLRIFTEMKSYMQDYDQEIDYDPQQIKPQPVIATETVLVISGTKKIKVDEDKRIREVFLRLAGADQEIDYEILQTILNELVERDFPYKFNGFSSDVCRSLLATMDTDVSGKLGFDEFMVLVKHVQLWKHAFKTFDKDGSGLLNTKELRAALNLTGYSVNGNIAKILVYRYAKNGEMNIDDFILCAVKLKTMIESFKSKDPKSTGLATLSKEEFIGHAMYS